MDNLAYIDDYFQGTLLPEEKNGFEKRLREDESFAEEVAFYLSAKKLVLQKLQEEKKARFKELYKSGNSQPAVVRSMNRTWLYAAAAVMILLVAGVLYFMQPSSVQQLADTYIDQNFNTLSVTMGSSEDSLQNGLGLYNEGRLTEAAQLFERISQADPANYTANMYMGITYLRLNQYDKAINYFTQLQADTTLRSNPGKLYLAITHLKRSMPGDTEEAKRLLQDVASQNLEGKETAEKWLQKL
ncbi:MAG: tetratricopeptide repeat protein [Chitinophagaceae bacterium]|nr:MAG: tetratricopeptide repeat protein [Chitinophagaceae bacterium]